MKKLLKILGDLLPTGMLVLGAVAVSCGIAMIYVPAGVISAGALAVIGGVLLSVALVLLYSAFTEE